jgi:hypothetical protein
MSRTLLTQVNALDVCELQECSGSVDSKPQTLTLNPAMCTPIHLLLFDAKQFEDIPQNRLCLHARGALLSITMTFSISCPQHARAGIFA